MDHGKKQRADHQRARRTQRPQAQPQHHPAENRLLDPRNRHGGQQDAADARPLWLGMPRKKSERKVSAHQQHNRHQRKQKPGGKITAGHRIALQVEFAHLPQPDPAQGRPEQDQHAHLNAARENTMERKAGQPVGDTAGGQGLPRPINRRRHQCPGHNGHHEVNRDFQVSRHGREPGPGGPPGVGSQTKPRPNAGGSKLLPEGRRGTAARTSRLPLLHSCPGGVRRSHLHGPRRRLAP